jgi:hypothetical protein
MRVRSAGLAIVAFVLMTTSGLAQGVQYPLPNAALEVGGNLAQHTTDFGAPGATACASDTASCNFNQLFQRIAQRLSTTITALGSPMQATGGTVGLTAGSAIIGKVGIDQTTPGTTNGVQVNAALPAGTNLLGKVGIDQTTPGTTNGVYILGIGSTAVVGDACSVQTPTYTPISITSATTTLIATGTAAKKTYICGLNLFTGLANNVALIEGTTATTCGTSPVGVIGGATAANGFNFAANGGETFGSGVASIAATATAHDDVCIITSSAGPLAGVMKWVQQ